MDDLDPGRNEAPQIVAVLRAIEERLSDLFTLETDPEGRIQQSQNDLLRTYGLSAQISEVITQQREQIQAMADALAILVGRFIEHDRRVTSQHDTMLALLQQLAHSVDQAEIAAAAADARALLQAEAAEREAEIELSADQAQALISKARMEAIGSVKRAIVKEQDAIAAAGEAARATVEDAEQHALDVIKDATDMEKDQS